MNQAELTKVFRNLQRVEENHWKFPPHLTAAEKDNLWMLLTASEKANAGTDIYNGLSQTFQGADECKVVLRRCKAA